MSTQIGKDVPRIVSLEAIEEHNPSVRDTECDGDGEIAYVRFENGAERDSDEWLSTEWVHVADLPQWAADLVEEQYDLPVFDEGGPGWTACSWGFREDFHADG